jgi:hypothetical protein
MMRYTPKTVGDLQKVLDADVPDNMRVEIGPGVPLDAKTVAELRALPAWPLGLALELPHKPFAPESVVKVQRSDQ